MKIKSNDIRVVSEIKLPEPKTKHMVQIYKALGIDRSCLLRSTAATKLSNDPPGILAARN